MLNKEIKQIDLTKRIAKLLLGKFKNRENLFKIKSETPENQYIIENNTYNPKEYPDNNKPGLGHWNNG